MLEGSVLIIVENVYEGLIWELLKILLFQFVVEFGEALGQLDLEREGHFSVEGRPEVIDQTKGQDKSTLWFRLGRVRKK